MVSKRIDAEPGFYPTSGATLSKSLSKLLHLCVLVCTIKKLGQYYLPPLTGLIRKCNEVVCVYIYLLRTKVDTHSEYYVLAIIITDYIERIVNL